MPIGLKELISRVDPRFIVEFASLVNDSPRKARPALPLTGVGDLAPSSVAAARAPVGSGAFGTVAAFSYNGAAVAVKELMAGAAEETIGAVLTLLGALSLPASVSPLSAGPR